MAKRKTPWSIPWLTWVAHFVISASATAIQIQFGTDPWRAASYPIVFYTAREVDQLSRKLWKKFYLKESVTFKWYDIGLDVVSSVVGAVLVALVL